LNELTQKNDQSRLILLEKMAALGNLTVGVAHEVNTPLSALKSNNDLFIRYFARLKEILFDSSMPSEVRENAKLLQIFAEIEKLNEINKTAATRIVQIVNSLRRFARVDKCEMEQSDLNEGLESTLTLVHHLLKQNIKVHKDFGDLPPVISFPNQINQVFLNILVNAIQAIGDDSEITIKTYPNENNAIIEISDTGMGIPQENLDKIFEPGFTTKKSGVGTGLGLSIVKQILDKHSGKIQLKSELGKGSTFTIFLPISQTDIECN
jgi:signal transduction histidine kinase